MRQETLGCRASSRGAPEVVTSGRTSIRARSTTLYSRPGVPQTAIRPAGLLVTNQDGEWRTAGWTSSVPGRVAVTCIQNGGSKQSPSWDAQNGAEFLSRPGLTGSRGRGAHRCVPDRTSRCTPARTAPGRRTHPSSPCSPTTAVSGPTPAHRLSGCTRRTSAR